MIPVGFIAPYSFRYRNGTPGTRERAASKGRRMLLALFRTAKAYCFMRLPRFAVGGFALGHGYGTHIERELLRRTHRARLRPRQSLYEHAQALGQIEPGALR